MSSYNLSPRDHLPHLHERRLLILNHINISEEILVRIFSFLTRIEKIKICRVCETFNAVVTSPRFWRNIDLTGNLDQLRMKELLLMTEPRKHLIENLILDGWDEIEPDKIVERLPNMRSLDLTSTVLHSKWFDKPRNQVTLPAMRKNHQKLETIVFTNCRYLFSHFLTPFLRMIPAVTKLYVGNTNISPIEMEIISKSLRQLEAIDLSYTDPQNISRVVPAQFPHISTIYYTPDERRREKDPELSKLFPNSNIFDQSFQDWVEDILEDSSGLDTVSSIEGIKDLIASGADKNLEGGKFKSTAWIASLTNLKDHTEFNTIIKNVVTKTVDDRPNWATSKIINHRVNGTTLLNEFAKLNDLEMVLFLLAHGGEPDLPIGEFSRDYILSTAVQLDHWDMAEIIFRYCRPKNLPHQLFRCLIDCKFDGEKALKIAEMAQVKGIKFTDIKGIEGTSLLHAAIESYNVKAVESLLTKHMVDPNEISCEMLDPTSPYAKFLSNLTRASVLYFALHQPAKDGVSENMIDLLLKHGASASEIVLPANSEMDPLMLSTSVEHPTHIQKKKAKGGKYALLDASEKVSGSGELPPKKKPILPPIFYAQTPEILEVLLKHGANINARDNNGRTLLWSAIKKRDPEFVKVVLERGAHIDNIGGPSGEPTNAFQLSLNFFKPGKTIEIIKLLHEHCKNPEMLSIPLMDVVNLGSLELLKQMVELRMVKVPIIPKGRLSIEMSRADLEASLKKVKDEKKKKDKNLKKEMMLNMTPPNPSYLGNKNSPSMDSQLRKALKEEQKEILISIVVRGKYDILNYMIELGFFNFDISKVVDNEGNNLFHYAARTCHDPKLFEYLYERRVSVVKKNERGQTPFIISCMHGNTIMIDHFLALNSTDTLWHDFIDDADDEGNTGLHYAVSNGDLKMVVLLIAKGHPVDVPNKAGQTPMDLCGNKDGKIYKALQTKMEHGHHHHGHEHSKDNQDNHDPETKKNCFASQVI
jgi:ankyrin repeat protein